MFGKLQHMLFLYKYYVYVEHTYTHFKQMKIRVKWTSEIDKIDPLSNGSTTAMQIVWV